MGKKLLILYNGNSSPYKEEGSRYNSLMAEEGVIMNMPLEAAVNLSN